MERSGDFRKRFEGWLRPDLHVKNGLGIDLEIFHEAVQRPHQGDEAGDLERSKQAISSSRIVEKDHVSGLFAAEVRTAAQHLLEHIAVADGYAQERESFGRQGALQAQ